MRLTRLMLTLALGACSLPLSFGADLASKKGMTLEVAKQMAAAAEAEAKRNNWNVVIVIVDDGANLVYLQKIDDTQIGSIDVAQEKAKTAVRYKRPTKAFEDALVGGRHAVLRLPGAIPVEGGIPITVDGKIIGGIGVSGVASNQDAQIAQAALNALPKILGR